MDTLTVTAKQLQKGIKGHLDNAQQDKIIRVIRHSQEVAVMISPERYQRLIEAVRRSFAGLSM